MFPSQLKVGEMRKISYADVEEKQTRIGNCK